MGNAESRPVLADSDFLIQVFLTRQRPLLAKFSRVRPFAVVEEVEIEVRNHRKFKRQFEPEFERAVANRELLVLDRSAFLHSGRDRWGETIAAEQFDSYQAIGEKYAEHVGQGEAYTHAAAVRLGVPVFSHDGAAIRILAALNLPSGRPRLTFFDLLRFGVAEGWVPADRAEESVKYLMNKGEWVPEALRRGSIEGIEPRILRAPVDMADTADKLILEP